jgi:hypothetical protein
MNSINPVVRFVIFLTVAFLFWLIWVDEKNILNALF